MNSISVCLSVCHCTRACNSYVRRPHDTLGGVYTRQYQCKTRRTDGRTDGRAIAYSALKTVEVRIMQLLQLSGRMTLSFLVVNFTAK